MANISGTRFPQEPKDEPITSKFDEGHNEAQVIQGQLRSSPNLKRKLKSRHLQMIAIGKLTKAPLYSTSILTW